MMDMRRTVKNILSLYILLLPILRYYELPGGSNLYLAIANIMVLYLIVRKRFINLNSSLLKGALFFVIWALIISFIAYNFASYKALIQPTSRNNLIVLCDWIFIAIACFHDAIEYDSFIKIYKYICYGLLIYILLQIVGIGIPGFTMTGRISFLNVLSTYSIRGSNFGVYPNGVFTRYSSLFIEPSHFSQYIAPFLCFTLFGYKEIIKRNIVMAGIVSGLMVMSISGTSIVIVLLIWFYFILTEIKELNLQKMLLLVAVFAFISIGIVIATQNAGVASMLDRMSNSGDRKVSDRVTRGFLVFLKLPLLEKIFGIGYQCVYPASVVYGIQIGSEVANNVKEYVNDIASVLLSFGIIGFCPILILLRNCFKRAKKGEIAMYITCLAIFISEATFGTVWLLLICCCIITFKNRNDSARDFEGDSYGV